MLTFERFFHIILQDKPWASYKDGIPVGEICFACSDLCGVLRPALEAVQCLSLHQSGEDPKFTADMTEALNVQDDEDVVGSFQPKSSVNRQVDYDFLVFQDVALLTETEFTRLCHLTPAQAGYGPRKNQKSPLVFAFGGPGTAKEYYPVGLQGMPIEEIFAVRKMRMQLADRVTPLNLDLDF